PALVSTPQALAYESALPDEEYKQAIIEKDDLQLAHYQRILEAHGWEAKDGRLAAILGSEGLCVWIDLDRVTRQKPSKTQGTKRRDAMERYAFEFGFRLDIMATAQQHLVDPSIPLLVEPWACDDCKSCKWRGYCLPLLEERQDASLLPHMKTLQRSRYGKAGLETMQAIAGLDPTTAALVRNGVKVAELLEFADDALPDGPLGEDKKMRRRRKQLAELKAVGIETFGRATDRLCRRTARIATDATAGHIDEARAALGPSAVYRRRGVSTITIPRADVEIDIDMESISKPSVTYLWGVLVQGHPDPSLNRYHHFSRFDTPTPELDSAVSGEFWFWLSQVIADCEARGLSLKIYCYHSPAEATALRRFAGSAGLEVEVERLVNSDLWVDMEKVFKDHFATGSGVGLKKVAILAGYAWDAEDAGGTESMLRFATAVESEDDDERKAAVDWLLRYNRGDVEATAHLRDWLTDNAGSIPPIESLDAMFDAPG
ncbi:MAG: ribonuclease H-like domain-containing protein, partial [Actinomycetota bacterium]